MKQSKKSKSSSKEEQLRIDWIAYNKKATRSNTQMSFDEYRKWVLNIKTKPSNVFVEYTPTLSKPSWANDNSGIMSVKSTTITHQPTRNTMMEKVKMGQEVGETATEIIKKSQRIGLLYSKGTYGYITDETDAKDLGKKNPTI